MASGEKAGVEGLRENEERLTDMSTNVVIAGWRGE